MNTKSKTIDCVLYNGEIDILKLRLEIYDEFVDEFHITEAAYTFTGIQKEKLLGDSLETDFLKYKHKIHYHLINKFPEIEGAWNKEFYLREQSVKLANPNENDLIILSDVDEIINLDYVLEKTHPDKINIIELECFYYFYNLKSTEKIEASMISEFKFIKNKAIGDRYNFYDITEINLVDCNGGKTGGHFTYQFGLDTSKYITKIKSFSHQEYNNESFLDNQKLKFLIKNEMDIFYRFKFKYKKADLIKTFPRIQQLINQDPQRFAITKTPFIIILWNQFNHKEYRTFRYNMFKHKIKQLLGLIKDN